MFTDSQIHDWHRSGYLKIDNFFSEKEAASCRQWIEDIESWPESSDRWMHHFESTPYGVRPSRTENVAPYHEALNAFLTSGKVMDALTALFGEAAVLYKEKINYKYPGGGGYAPHQDAMAYHPVSKHITCLIAIDHVTQANGCLSFSPYPHGARPMDTDDAGCVPEEVAAEMEWLPVESTPLDILFFHSYTPHKSGPNTSESARRILYVTYNALSEGDWRAEYYENKRRKLSIDQSVDPDNKGNRISLIGHFQGTSILKDN